MARRGVMTALQAALAGIGGAAGGYVQMEETKRKRMQEEEDRKRQQALQAVTLAASGVRRRQPTAQVPGAIGALPTETKTGPQPLVDESASRFSPVPGFEEYEMGPTPAELRAEALRTQTQEQKDKEFERTNRSRFNLLQRQGYFPKELSYEDMRGEDLASDFQTFLQEKRDAAALQRAQVRPDYGEPIVAVTTPEGESKFVTRSQAIGMTPGGTESGMATRSAAQINTAINTSQSAHERMIRFEDKILSGDAKIGAIAATLARRAYGVGADAAAAEALLNSKFPDIAEYVRDAKAIGVSERLITPRGGSNYLTQTEIALAGAGPNASPKQVIQARSYRDALVRGLSEHKVKQAGPTEQVGAAPPPPIGTSTTRRPLTNFDLRKP